MKRKSIMKSFLPYKSLRFFLCILYIMVGSCLSLVPHIPLLPFSRCSKMMLPVQRRRPVFMEKSLLRMTLDEMESPVVGLSEAEKMKQQAKRMRLEAEELSINLTMKKIQDLEDKLGSASISSEDATAARLQIDQLTRSLSRSKKSDSQTTKVPGEISDAANVDVDNNSVAVETIVNTKEIDEEIIASAIDSWKVLSPIEKRVRALFLKASDLEVEEAETFIRTVWDRNEISQDALKDPDMVAWDLTAVAEDDALRYKDLTDDELRIQLSGSIEIFYEILEYERAKERDEVTDEMATGVLEKIFSSAMKDELRRQGVREEDIDTWTDMKMQRVLNLIPDSTLFSAPSDDSIECFFKMVTDSDVFNPTNRPEKVPGGFIIRGHAKTNGDDLISNLDELIASSEIANKIQFFYVLDPIEKSEEELDRIGMQIGLGDASFDDLECPLLLVTGPDITPDENELQGVANFLGLGNIIYFCLTSFGEVGSLSGENVVSLLLPIICLQLIHDLGHRIIAVLTGTEISLPYLIPGGGIGSYGTIIDLQSPPRNRSALFDLAVSGPLVGIISSILLLFAGLLRGSTSTDVTNFPSVSIEFLRSSSLASEIVSKFMGGDLFFTGQSADTFIHVHPWVVSAYLGIIINGINFLPLKVTDGGRMLQAALGRTYSKLPEAIAFLCLFLAGFFGKDEMNILVVYAFFVSFALEEKDLPCRNEVDDIGIGRSMFSIFAIFVAALALTPLAS